MEMVLKVREVRAKERACNYHTHTHTAAHHTNSCAMLKKLFASELISRGLATVNMCRRPSILCLCAFYGLSLLFFSLSSSRFFHSVICRLLTTFGLRNVCSQSANVYLCALMRIYGFERVAIVVVEHSTNNKKKSSSAIPFCEHSQRNANELFHRGHKMNRHRLSHSFLCDFFFILRIVLMEIKLDLLLFLPPTNPLQLSLAQHWDAHSLRESSFLLIPRTALDEIDKPLLINRICNFQAFSISCDYLFIRVQTL